MAPTETNLAIITAAGATAVLLAARAFKPSSKISHNLVDLNPDDCIQPDDVIDVFDDLFLHMQSVLAQLSQEIQKLQMAGQSIPEAQLRVILKSEFERNLKGQQQAIFDKHDVDEDCLQEATWEFMENPEEYPKVKLSVERFQKLYENVTGEKTVGKRPGGSLAAIEADLEDIPKDKLIEAAATYFDALTVAMGDIVKKMKSEGKDLNDPSQAQDVQMQFATVANSAGEKALEAMDISMDSFKASIDKHSSDPNVGRALAMMQMKQQQELAALGVPV
jgi:hypothetical protein